MWMKGYVGGNLKNKIRGRVNPALMDRCYCLETLPGRQLQCMKCTVAKSSLQDRPPGHSETPVFAKKSRAHGVSLGFRAPVFKLCGFQARVNLGFSIISSVTYISRCAPTQGAGGCVLPCFCHSIDATWTVTWDLPHLWALVSPSCNESRCRASPVAGALCAPMHPPRQILLARCQTHQAAVHRGSVPRLQMHPQLMQHLAHRISGFRLKCESVYCQPCIGSWKCKGPSLTFCLRNNRHRLSWKPRPFTSCVHVSWINAWRTSFSRREDQAQQDDTWSLVGCCSGYTGNSWKTMDSSSPLPACKWSAFRVPFGHLGYIRLQRYISFALSYLPTVHVDCSDPALCPKLAYTP